MKLTKKSLKQHQTRIAAIRTARGVYRIETCFNRYMGKNFYTPYLKRGKRHVQLGLTAEYTLDTLEKAGQRIKEHMKQNPPESYLPKVGMGATLHLWSDKEPFFIVEVSSNLKRIKVQSAKAELVKGPGDCILGGFSAIFTNQSQQEWKVTPDPEGRIAEYSLRKSGRWIRTGCQDTGGACFLTIGYAYKFYDYNF